MSTNRDKYKYLFKNMGLLTLSNFASKLLSFFLIPLYTNALSTSQYGEYDLISTTLAIMIPVLTINIQEGMMRFSLEKKYEKSDILFAGIKYLLSSSLIVALLLTINYIFGFFDAVKKYTFYFAIMFFMQTLSGMLSSYIRGNEKIADLSIGGVLCTLVSISTNILFLVGFKWGLKGFFLSGILSSVFYNCFIIFKVRHLLVINFRSHNDDTIHEIEEYCKPTVLNAVAWWVNSASDRYVVTYFLGVSENGIYAVASKIPAILNIVQSIFSQAWSISAVKDYDSKDTNGFFSKTYNTYNCILTVGCAFLIAFDKIIAKFLYAKDFYSAWRFVPWLTIAIVFGALSGYIGGIFLAVKVSGAFGKSSTVGAAANILLNFILIPYIGAIGAAIATTFTYLIVWIVRVVQINRHIEIKICFTRDIISYCLLFLQSVLLIFMSGCYSAICQCFLLILVVLLYRTEIIGVIKVLLSFLEKRTRI